jgi:hypothetical protein
MKIYQILVTKKVGEDYQQVDAGTITLNDDGTVSGEATPGYERLVHSTLKGFVLTDGGTRRIYPEDDPKAWFERLPHEYTGSVLRIGPKA